MGGPITTGSADGRTTRGPRRRRKAERTPEIIAAGIASFAERGYADTRLEDVAERAGIAKSTIYLYFENKEALFRATVEARVRTAIGEIDEVVADFDGDTGELLTLVLMKSYERFVDTDASALLRTIIAEGERFPELRQVFYDAHLGHGAKILGRILRRGVERGEFRDAPVREFPRMLIAPTMLACIWRMTFDTLEPIDVERFARAHVDLLLRGLLRGDEDAGEGGDEDAPHDAS